MNKNIRQLVESAPYTTISTEGRLFSQRDMAVFAEALVRECAEVVSNQYSEDWGKWSNRMILEHFGVES